MTYRAAEPASAAFRVSSLAWKLIWIGTVGIPHLVSGDMDAAAREVLFNCSFVVVIIAVFPWRYAWRRYVRTPGDAWR